MDVMLIAGEIGRDIKTIIEKEPNINVIRVEYSIEEACSFLQSNRLKFDCIVLMDYAINISKTRLKATFERFIKFINEYNKPFVFISNNLGYSQTFNEVFQNNDKAILYYIEKVKIPFSFLVNIITKVCQENLDDNIPTQTKSNDKRKWGFFSNDKTKNNTKNNIENSNKCKVITLNQKKSIIITGHNCSGVSSLVANIANEASNNGIKTLILDLNLENRGQNLYFDAFSDEASKNLDIRMSLIRILLKPDSYKENTCRVNKNLYLSSLAYSVSKNEKYIESITPERIIALITALKQEFDFIILDIPLDFLQKMQEIIVYIDKIALCINNNMHSIINTVVGIESFEEKIISLLKLKVNIIVTKYNSNNEYEGKQFTSKMVSEIFASISTNLDVVLSILGEIPYSNEYDLQIDRGSKISSYNETFKNIFIDILVKLNT